MASDMAVLYGNDAFSILALSTKKQCCSFLKVFAFPRNCFKVKVLKTFKVFTDCQIEAWRPLKWKAPVTIPRTVF